MSDETHLVIILDRSGSMEARKADHEGGLRSFIADQKKLAGEVLVTFVRFDSADPCEVVMAERPLDEVKDEDLVLLPRGGTPLLDAVGETLTKFGHLAGRVILMVITDGGENQSRTWTRKAVQDLMKSKEAAGWTPLYLGANVDEFAEAGSLGVSGAAAAGYANTARGVGALYHTTSYKLMQARVAPMGMAASIMAFSTEDRAMLKDEDPKKETP